ncbi:MAG: hypothetical protein QM346_12655 [Chloroflexota bacterium]|nr:hypothetical protein [Chloroflexota bacterium]
MAEWVKLHAKIAESEDLAALHAADPTAALLFLMSLPVAAPWGILPRAPAVYAGRVAPMLGVGLDKAETCLRLIIDRGMYQEYTDRDGKAHLYVTAWMQNQTRQWERVCPPPCDLPPNWDPPEDIAKALQASVRMKRWLTVEALESHLQDAESKTRLRLVLDQSKTSLTREERERQRPLDVRLGDNVNTNGNDLLSESADDALPDAAIDAPPADPPATTPKRKQRKAMTDDEAESMIALARADLPPGCLDLVETLMDLVAAQNKTGRMALSREATLTTDLADKCKRDGIGTDALRHGLTAAIAKGAANINYVIKAANGYDPARASPGQPSRNGKAFQLMSNGSRCYVEDWSLTQQHYIAIWQAEGVWDAHTGCTTEPRTGACCNDGWYYANDDNGTLQRERRIAT